MNCYQSIREIRKILIVKREFPKKPYNMNKKIIFCIGIILLMSSCSDLADTKPDNSELFTSEDLNLIGTRHNEGISFVFQDFENSTIAYKFNTLKKKGLEISNEDKLELLEYLDMKAKEFILNNPLTCNGEDISEIEYSFDDEQLLDLADYEAETETATELQKLYIERMTDQYNSSIPNEELEESINNIIAEAQQIIEDETELLPILIMGSILVDSDNYWKTSMKKGGGSIALADAANGISGALWGSVAGPLGAAVVGLNAAIIGSCSAYIIASI